MKDSDELEVYIDTLEKTLERCDIPEDNYSTNEHIRKISSIIERK